jgi:hypothetical protein
VRNLVFHVVHAQILSLVVGEVGSNPPRLVCFITSLVPQDVLVVAFLLIPLKQRDSNVSNNRR